MLPFTTLDNNLSSHAEVAETDRGLLLVLVVDSVEALINSWRNFFPSSLGGKTKFVMR